MFFSSISNRTKTEGTSQTYGQMVLIKAEAPVAGSNILSNENITNQEPLVSPNVTVVNVLETVGAGSVEIDKVKSQVSMAAHSDNIQNNTIVLKSDKSSESALDTGTLSNTKIITATVVGSTLKTKDEIKNILTEAQKTDLFISLKSKDSEKLEFNSMQVPELDAKFNYQFFVDGEDDIEEQEDPAKDPLLKASLKTAPRFVEIRWDIIEASEELTDKELGKVNTKEVKAFKDKVFKDPRGNVSYKSNNLKNSFNKSSKKFNLLNLNESVKTEIVDVHKLEKAFDSVSNEKTFSNSINASINIGKNSSLFNIFLNSDVIK